MRMLVELLPARTKTGWVGVGEPMGASHILGKGTSATRPLQNSLNDVIRVWSESRKAVGCSVSLGLLRLTSDRRTGGSNA